MRSGNAIARKIYKSVHKIIPKDSEGRSFEIHHIDGDHTNNDINNLVAISLEQHYNVHIERGDLAAAHRIAGRLSMSGEEISELARKRNQKWVEEGRHNWQGGDQQRELNKKRVEAGTHNFLNGGGIKPQYARGKPPWGTREDVSRRTHKQLAEGKHPWTDTEKQRERQERLLSEGRHVSQIKVTCPHCNKLGPLANMKQWHFDKCKDKK
jgi:hypothetical protein